MSLSWSNEETVKFIQLYECEPVIWNPKDKFHKDKNKVNDAWIRIANSLHVPVAELKKKKETLMSAFRLHFKRKKDSIRSDLGEQEVYKPIWVFYDAMEAFLKDNYECKRIISTEGENNSSPFGQKAAATEEVDEEKTEVLNGAGNNAEENDNKIKISVKRRRAYKPPELEKAEKEMTNVFNTLNQAILNKDQHKEDECELYGRLLANKLRKYSEIERHEIMYEIDGILLRRCRNNSPYYVSSPSQIIISKRPSSSASSYTCPSPSSPYLFQIPQHVPSPQIPASEQTSYTHEEIYVSPNTPIIHVPEESVRIMSNLSYSQPSNNLSDSYSRAVNNEQ